MSRKSSKLKNETPCSKKYITIFPFMNDCVGYDKSEENIFPVTLPDLLRCHIRQDRSVKSIDDHYRDFHFISGNGTIIHMIKGEDCENNTTVSQYVNNEVISRTSVVQIFMYARQKSKLGGDYSIDDFGSVFFVLTE